MKITYRINDGKNVLTESRDRLEGMLVSKGHLIPGKIKKVIVSVLRTLLLIGLSYVIIQPIFYMATVSVRPTTDLMDLSVQLLPKNITSDWFLAAFKGLDYVRVFYNTLLLSAAAAAFQVLSTSLAGYGFARFEFREKNLLFFFVILTIIVPPALISTPMFLNYMDFDIFGVVSFVRKGLMGKTDAFRLIGTPAPIVLPTLFGFGLKSGLYIYMFRQYYKSVPKELEESAMIDGCGFFGTYRRIMFPNVIPGIVTVLLLSLVWHWNDTFFTRLYLSLGKFHTLNTKYDAAFFGHATVNTTDFDQAQKDMAAGILVTTPLIIFYIIAQKFLIKNVLSAGIKG